MSASTLSAELLAAIKGAKNKYSRNQSNAVKLKEGKTLVRLLARPNEVFWRDLGVHWIKTEVNGKPVAVVGCHDAVYGKPCPVCTAIEKAKKAATDDETLALINEWRAKKEVLFNALILNGPDKSEDPQILSLTPTTAGAMMNMIEEYVGHDINILDPEKGHGFIVERTGRGLDTKYTVMPTPKVLPIKPEVYEKMHDLDAFIEREYFRGDEKKALTAITQVTGVPTSGLLSGPTSSTPLLTGAGAIVEDAAVIEEAIASLEEDEAPKTVPAAAPSPAAAEPPAATAPAGSKPASAEATAPASDASAGDDFNSVLNDEEIAKMLAELG